ncbi:serine/threonine exchanger SteT [Marinithermofilum abyssi]|uniref:Serine/threonine exchanger SteT n=1 Tax=Marinithermofilum abyssi TaxID=1571185 RepID=A0A8J2YB22_9BACL|nr:amino acid permease [Marinithermofilum abyssi]GGE26225.1 serine/threonine exchanger SteT [Marinithermofilum abyssi]
MSEKQLKKELGFAVAFSLVVGTTIGSGVFMKPGEVLEYTGGSSMALLAWLLGGVITLASGLTVAEVSAQIPKTGGLYVYMEEAYGKVWGYLSGWVQTVIYGPAIIGALGLYMGSMVTFLFGWEKEWAPWIGIGTVFFMALVNSLGTKYAGWVQTVSTGAKLIPIVLIIVFGLWKGEAPVFGADSGSGAAEFSMGAAILATLFAYDGWILVGSVAGEMKNPSRILPKAIFIGIGLITVVYLLVNAAILHILPAEQIVKLGENAAGAAASVVFGPMGGKLITIGIIVSIFGSLNGKVLTFPRVPFAMAERGQLPGARLLSWVHPAAGTPVIAILLQVTLATLMMLAANPDKLTQISIFIIFIFYSFVFAAVFLLRRRHEGRVRPYSVPLYPWVPLLAIAGSGFVVVSTLIQQPADSLAAIGITLAGLPMYWLLKRRRQTETEQHEQKAS